MILVNKKSEECPYCDHNIKIEGDSDRSVWKWHLSGHNQIKQFYRANDKIEKLIANYAHDFRSERYDEEIMTIMLRDFWKRATEKYA